MIIITNGKIITPRDVLENHCVVIENGVIKQIVPDAQVPKPDDARVIDAGGAFVSPGFVDIHVHGAVGRDTMEGSVEALAEITKFHASGGTTALTPSLIGDTRERMTAALDAIQQAMDQKIGGARILGAHMEGPYVNRKQAGALPEHFIRDPNPEEYLPWLDREGLVTHMTLAPELPGAMELIDALMEREMVPCGGHTSATGDEIEAAVDRGLCHATHLFSAMSAVTKIGPIRVAGAVEAFLADDRTMVEVIADGKHLPPLMLRMTVNAKGVDNVCIITDATAGAGLPEGAEYTVGATRAVVHDGVGVLPNNTALAGSAATMMRVVRTMVEKAGVSMSDAVRMASLNPARVLSLAGRKGSLEPNKDADVVIFTPTFEVQTTIIGGRIEFQRA
ncbi:MAG: N-acetylglucosamine-6-phosphate deacetylase [Verrucomicrobia bacterium]|nr:N-acetylglucosamine-6-phosphate deacetylase [Verrucomicrobiota bacterium]